MSTSTNHSWMLWTEPRLRPTVGSATREQHSQGRVVGGRFFVPSSGVVQCTIDYTGHVLHARIDSVVLLSVLFLCLV